MTSDDIRENLLTRATTYAVRAGVSFSTISVSAVNDSKFLHRVSRGENFNINTYQRVLDWLDRAELELRDTASADDVNAAPAASRPAKSASTFSQAVAR